MAKPEGYRIDPAEIEDALKKREGVTVIGIPDAIRDQVVKALLAVKTNVSVDECLAEELQARVRNVLQAHVALMNSSSRRHFWVAMPASP